MFYVYVDYLPDQTPFYVGKGNAKRIKKLTRNKWHSSICVKYPDWFRKPIFTGTEAECHAEEMQLIALYGRRDLGLGTLVNLTNGGEGVAGMIASEEMKAKLRASNVGKVLSPEHREKMRVSSTGKTHNAATREKIRLAVLNMSDETRARVKAAKQYTSDETRAKMSAAGMGRTVSPETRAKISAGLRGRARSPEVRAKISAGHLARWAA